VNGIPGGKPGNVAYVDVCITSLLLQLIFVVLVSTCFGLDSRPSSRSVEAFRGIQCVWQIIET
jgi:hypothetical protein